MSENEKLVDVLDLAARNTDRERSFEVAEIRKRAASIPVGEPGDCEECGQYFTRTVDGYCGRCRDLLGRP